MKINRGTSRLLLILMTIAVVQQPASAATEGVDETKTADDGQIEAATDEPDQKSRPAPTEVASPETDRLRNRDLGKAIEQFTPSEAISADNAVPFPVDI
ncbi:MAG: hypothetical protein O2780_07055 [Proteobacteria bacterium]|jgi:hypothetical protein|nr:hypothetical protein [Pseudomonadota bacterium]MDA1299772.1 hypothetical protein [Pseudomonadota bacterium]